MGGVYYIPSLVWFEHALTRSKSPIFKIQKLQFTRIFRKFPYEKLTFFLDKL